MDLIITPLEACKLIADDYMGIHDPCISATLNSRGVQASIYNRDKDGKAILIIRGTNQFSDWFRYNFHIISHTRDGGEFRWQGGFLDYAEAICDFVTGKQIDLVIGHSLGAAATQIVSTMIDVPGLGFASPRPLHSGKQPPNSDKVRNYCRPDDLVTMLPPTFLGFHHVGVVDWLDLHGRHFGEDHGIANYMDLLRSLLPPDEQHVVPEIGQC